MDLDLHGIRVPDERWKKMMRVWEACTLAGVPKPVEVHEFFGHKHPDEDGVTVSLTTHAAVKAVGDEGQDGFLVDLRALPKDLTHLRFTTTY